MGVFRPDHLLNSPACGHALYGNSLTSALARHLRTKHNVLEARRTDVDSTQKVFDGQWKIALSEILLTEKNAAIFEALVKQVLDKKKAF